MKNRFKNKNKKIRKFYLRNKQAIYQQKKSFGLKSNPQLIEGNTACH